ncbi:hypothetical protein KIH24_15320 [Rhizobiales bacterium TNE-4]|nr:hypothetical protein [Rhizobiales bacterium TNE-4]MBV1828994.1 hypothetical protein [Rhizobiales bacterium TNE-4]
MKSPFSSRKTKLQINQKSAIEILRNRTFRKSNYSDDEIQQAVILVRALDPDHPLLRYNERQVADMD